MKDLAVIIVAGGSGQRMGTELPKQFIVYRGLPILLRTLMAFEGAAQRVVVLPGEHIDYWSELIREYGITIPHTVVEGGSSRFQSVSNGLRAVDTSVGFVAVHDGVRPFVSQQVISNTLACARERGAAIPAIELTDTVRIIDDSGESRTLERGRLRAIQTPQIFRRDIIVRAYEQSERSVFTDDASVVESLPYAVTLSEGSPENIKITYPRDLK